LARQVDFASWQCAFLSQRALSRKWFLARKTYFGTSTTSAWFGCVLLFHVPETKNVTDLPKQCDNSTNGLSGNDLQEWQKCWNAHVRRQATTLIKCYWQQKHRLYTCI